MISKSKGLLALACMGLLAVGTGALAISNSASSGKTVKVQQAAAATRVDSAITIAEDVSVGGNAVYVAIPEGSGWYEASAKFAIRFVDDDTTKDGWTAFILGSNWVGKDDYGTNIYQSTVPTVAGVSNWDHMQVFRFDPNTETPTTNPNWGNGAYHTIDTSKNQIKVHGTVDSNSENYTTSAAERIKFWANVANQWTTSGVCVDSSKSEGDTNPSALSDSWTYMAGIYDTIQGADVKDYFKHTEGVEDSPIMALNVMARYDHICTRYHLTDFAGRFVAE